MDSLDCAGEPLDGGRDFVGTAVAILKAVDRLWLPGTFVDGVGDPVGVVVGVAAPIGVFESVPVLGLGRAGVEPIDDPITIRIDVGASGAFP